jgi:hypothetical protein
MVYLAISLVLYSFFVCFYSMKYLVGRPSAILFVAVALLSHHLLVLEALGRSKPFEAEFRNLEGEELIAYSTVGDSQIHVWISVNGRPVAYVLEYSPEMLANIANAVEQAGRNGRPRVRTKDSHGIDLDDPTFHAAPPPPAEPKNAPGS